MGTVEKEGQVPCPNGAAPSPSCHVGMWAQNYKIFFIFKENLGSICLESPDFIMLALV